MMNGAIVKKGNDFYSADYKKVQQPQPEEALPKTRTIQLLMI